jgi:hypothetical protein
MSFLGKRANRESAHLTGGQGVAGFGLVVLAVLLSVFAYLGLKITMVSDWTPHGTSFGPRTGPTRRAS